MRLKAFTLIETILYLALFNVIFFSVITWAISLSQSNRNAEFKNAVEKNAIFITEHLNDTFQKGLTIDSVNSTFDDADGKIRITSATGYLEYRRNGNLFTVTNGTSIYSLSDAFVQVTNFRVEPVIVQPNTYVGAKITITITAEKFPTLTKTITSYYALR